MAFLHCALKSDFPFIHFAFTPKRKISVSQPALATKPQSCTRRLFIINYINLSRLRGDNVNSLSMNAHHQVELIITINAFEIKTTMSQEKPRTLII